MTTLYGYDTYLEEIVKELQILRTFLAQYIGTSIEKSEHDSFRDWETTLWEQCYALTELIDIIRKEQDEKGA